MQHFGYSLNLFFQRYEKNIQLESNSNIFLQIAVFFRHEIVRWFANSAGTLIQNKVVAGFKSVTEYYNVCNPTAIPYIFELNDKNEVHKHFFLGDADEIARKMQSVANQAAKK